MVSGRSSRASPRLMTPARNGLLPFLLGHTAEAEMAAGERGAAMARIGEAFAAMKRTWDVAWAADLHCIRADLLLQGPVPQAERAATDLKRAIEIARGQQARSLCTPRPASPACGPSRARGRRRAIC